jgi:hypothetical protein
VIPVAILGSTDFDVSQIDPGTVTLEGLAIRAVGKSNKLLAHIEDVNDDGFRRLATHARARWAVPGEPGPTHNERLALSLS